MYAFSHIFYCNTSPEFKWNESLVTTYNHPFCFEWQVFQMSFMLASPDRKKLTKWPQDSSKYTITQSDLQLPFALELDMDKVLETQMHYSLWREKERGNILTVSPVFLLLFLLFSSGYGFKTVSCVPPLCLDGIPTEIKGHTVTGCSEHTNGCCDRATKVSEWFPGKSHFTPPEKNLGRSHKLASRWCANHAAPRQTCQHGA